MLICFSPPTDVDECANANGGCEGPCCNTVGGFYCRCPPGYQLQSDGRTCQGRTCLLLYSALGENGGSRSKPKLELGVKSLWGKGPHARGCQVTPIGTLPVKDCQKPGAGSILPALNEPLDSAPTLLASCQQNQDQTEVDPGETQGTEEGRKLEDGGGPAVPCPSLPLPFLHSLAALTSEPRAGLNS